MQAEILHHPNWAQTALGTPIELYQKIHTSGRPILFVGGIHGDEPEGVRLAQDFLAWLQNTPDKIVHNWLLIPDINPDGSSRKQRTNSNGVDLNRNFPSPDWSSEAKAPRYNPGPSPGSELEIQALIQLIQKHNPKLIVHFHSWEPCVVYTGASAKVASEIIGKGTTYPVREDIGYPTPGSLGQYGWYTLHTPVICVEAQDHSPLDTIWPIFMRGLKSLMQTPDLGLKND
ncbi:MAG: DUF2817 domain-containing protein [Bdellovibrionia bacterium]